MSTLVHGIELDAEGNPAWLRFGILSLLGHLLFSNSAEPSVQDWQQRFRSEAFRHQVRHFQQCFWKFDRAAGHVARCRQAADGALGRIGERIRRGEQVPLLDPDRLVMDDTNADLPLFLDGMLFYLSIQADSYAQLIPYFYEDANAGICTRSFTKQLRWFCDDRRPYDLAYTSILNENRTWRDQLVGWKNGLRGVVTHESGILSVGWAKPEDGPIEPKTALFRSSGIGDPLVEKNVIGALQEITVGWYTFLDCAWHHFVPRLTNAGVLLTMSVNDLEETRYVNCREEELQGLWVYPRAPQRS